MFLFFSKQTLPSFIVPILLDDKDQKKSQKVLLELENIDDECDSNNIAFVKIDNDEEAKEYGIDSLPALIFFEKRIPHIYEGMYVFSPLGLKQLFLALFPQKY